MEDFLAQMGLEYEINPDLKAWGRLTHDERRKDMDDLEWEQFQATKNLKRCMRGRPKEEWMRCRFCSELTEGPAKLQQHIDRAHRVGTYQRKHKFIDGGYRCPVPDCGLEWDEDYKPYVAHMLNPKIHSVKVLLEHGIEPYKAKRNAPAENKATLKWLLEEKFAIKVELTAEELKMKQQQQIKKVELEVLKGKDGEKNTVMVVVPKRRLLTPWQLDYAQRKRDQRRAEKERKQQAALK